MFDYQEPELAIGIMSGTSADGVDSVLMACGANRVSILTHAYQPFKPELSQQITAIRECRRIDLHDFCLISHKISEAYNMVCQELMAWAKQHKKKIQVIGAHGQTIWHEPPFYSLQLCHYANLASQTGLPVVGDFRNMDIANGGQGAPLAPLFHEKIFRKEDKVRAIINLGGIANITIIQDKTVGWDIGPGMTLMDHWIHQSQGKKYDDGGQWAKTGHVHQELLSLLINDPYFEKAAPKSTGQEYFHPRWLANNLEKIGAVKAEDVQATLHELLTLLCIQTIQEYNGIGEVYFCGGGAKNNFLIDKVRDRLSAIHVGTTDELGIDVAMVEASLMGWLALQRLHHRPIDTSTVTGSRSDSPQILGCLYRPSHR